MDKIEKELDALIKRFAVDLKMSERDVRKWIIAELVYLNKLK